jgi:predicted sulfurtransferase
MFTNIAAYKFAALESLKERRAAVLALCRELELKGTILLSTEGINLFVAGSPPAVDRLLAELRSIPGLEDLTPKFSESAHQPFNRMLVRIKKEIIAFGVEGIDPARRPSPKLAPHILKQWLDEGRPVTLLDTRNDYEVKLGTFKQAVPAGIDHFREFPDAVRRLPEKLKDQPIVMFCTGGIRCEKAGPFMEREGFRQIYQLDGGILKYFEDCGSAHYEGECFVFDRRVGVDPALRETESALCFRCQAPLTVEEQADPRYQPPHSCPHCFKAPGEQRAEILHQRHEAIRRAANPLPGLQPHENRRPLIIPPDYAGATLLDFLCGIFPEVSRDEWLLRCHSGYLLNTRGSRCPRMPASRQDNGASTCNPPSSNLRLTPISGFSMKMKPSSCFTNLRRCPCTPAADFCGTPCNIFWMPPGPRIARNPRIVSMPIPRDSFSARAPAISPVGSNPSSPGAKWKKHISCVSKAAPSKKVLPATRPSAPGLEPWVRARWTPTMGCPRGRSSGSWPAMLTIRLYWKLAP